MVASAHSSDRGVPERLLPTKYLSAFPAVGDPAQRRRIYIVDDHTLFIAGLSSLINHVADLEVCGSGQDGEQVVREIRQLQPDLVILDIQLRHTNGLTVAATLRRLMRNVRILFLSSLADPRLRQRAQELGAQGFLEKTQDPEHILDGIRHALLD